MDFQFLISTPDIEELVATALLTTSTGSSPSRIFRRMKRSPAQVKELVQGLLLQHGSIMEHNRITWLAKATDGEVLELLLVSRFFTVSRIGQELWLVSANLRTLMEYIVSRKALDKDQLLKTLSAVAPTILECMETETR